MKKLTLLALIASAITVGGCSGGNDVVDKPPPVRADDKNQYKSSIDKGPGAVQDGQGTKGAASEGTG